MAWLADVDLFSNSYQLADNWLWLIYTTKMKGSVVTSVVREAQMVGHNPLWVRHQLVANFNTPEVRSQLYTQLRALKRKPGQFMSAFIVEFENLINQLEPGMSVQSKVESLIDKIDNYTTKHQLMLQAHTFTTFRQAAACAIRSEAANEFLLKTAPQHAPTANTNTTTPVPFTTPATATPRVNTMGDWCGVTNNGGCAIGVGAGVGTVTAQ